MNAPLVAHELARVYRDERGRLVATLIRLVGSFDLAEEIGAALHLAPLRW
jgi:predicted RNA polymerase sigma factor